MFSEADAWLADNTDGRGLVRDLSANQGRDTRGSRICIIGAGGATAGILGAILAVPVASIARDLVVLVADDEGEQVAAANEAVVGEAAIDEGASGEAAVVSLSLSGRAAEAA